MPLQKTSYASILFSSAHLETPFKYQAQKSEGLITNCRLSKGTKITVWLVAIILAIPTLGVGSIASAYLISAAAKYRAQRPNSTVAKVMTVSTKEFCPRSLQNRQTRFNHIPTALIPPIRDVPAKGIKVRITNIGNTCWLNSLLKFLASDSTYDTLLARTDAEIRDIIHAGHASGSSSAEAEIDKRINLRDHLRFIIGNLRSPVTNDKTELDPRYVAGLVELLHSYNNDFGYAQCDSSEALLMLNNLFEMPSADTPESNEIPRLTTTYQNQHLKRSALNETTPVIVANAARRSIYDDGLIDLDKCVNNPSVETMVMSSDEDEQGLFTVRTGLTNAPEALTLQIARRDADVKYNNKVKIDDQLRTNISLFKPNHKGRLKKQRAVGYEMTGAIVHKGSGKSGHYIFMERIGDKYFCHDDSRLTEMPPAEARDLFEHASTFKLKKIAPLIMGRTARGDQLPICSTAARSSELFAAQSNLATSHGMPAVTA